MLEAARASTIGQVLRVHGRGLQMLNAWLTAHSQGMAFAQRASEYLPVVCLYCITNGLL